MHSNHLYGSLKHVTHEIPSLLENYPLHYLCLVWCVPLPTQVHITSSLSQTHKNTTKCSYARVSILLLRLLKQSISCTSLPLLLLSATQALYTISLSMFDLIADTKLCSLRDFCALEATGAYPSVHTAHFDQSTDTSTSQPPSLQSFPC